MNVLYLSYTGLLEPLGQSQILNYLQLLSNDHSISLITFEKKNDLADENEFNRLKKICENSGIDWVPLTYHKKPRLLATLYDLWSFLINARSLIKKKKAQLIHCRGYVPAFAGLLLNRLTKRPFIFDMRSFWPEELISAGRLKKKSTVYKIVKKLERAALWKSDKIATLTNASAQYLIKQGLPANKISVIPTCVNLNNFTLPSNKKENDKVITLGVIGTVTGWFQFDWVLKFYSVLKQEQKGAQLKIVSRDNKQWILNKAKEFNLDNELQVHTVPFKDIPKEMHALDAGVFFYKPFHSELARSPTKMGELLASGVACVANSGVGDVAHIINKYKVGVIIDNDDNNTLVDAVRNLQDLLKDPELPARCRRAAEEWFSIEKGVVTYSAIYQEISSEIVNQNE